MKTLRGAAEEEDQGGGGGGGGNMEGDRLRVSLQLLRLEDGEGEDELEATKGEEISVYGRAGDEVTTQLRFLRCNLEALEEDLA